MFQYFDQIITLTYVLIDNFCPCFLRYQLLSLRCTVRFTWYCNHTEMHPLSYNWIRGRRGWFYCYYIHPGNKSYKESQIVRKKFIFMHTKRLILFLNDGCNSVWVKCHVFRTVHTSDFLFLMLKKRIRTRGNKQ